MKKLKVCLTGLFYPMAMLRYFERALERRDDIELITVGPYTDSWIPWNGGMTVLPKYAKSPTHPLPRNFLGAGKASPYIFQMFEDLKDVDLWLEVDAGFYIDPKPENGIVAHVATDPHALNYDRQRQLADYFFNMQLVYSKPNDIYLPYAYDPTVHYPIETEMKYDVCMIGLHYQQRTELVNRLIGEGLKVHYSIGEIFDEYRETYNASWVGINWSSLLDTNARVFELAAMGVAAVQNTTPDMKNFLTAGEDYLEFTNVDEAVNQVLKLHIDNDMLCGIANNALAKIEPHTYDARVQQILETVGLA